VHPDSANERTTCKYAKQSDTGRIK
jgi:hypothetical protein